MAPQRTDSELAANVGALGFLVSLVMAVVGVIGALVGVASNNETAIMTGLGITVIAATLSMITAMLLWATTRGDK